MAPKASLSCLLGLCALLLVPLALVDGKEYVITLDSSSFDEIVPNEEFIVVEFYAPWCGHCKNLAPEYEKAAKALEESGSTVKLAKVDADDAKNKGLAKKYEVKGFPTLKIFRKGSDTPQDYNGPRDADGIVSYLKKQSGPATSEAKSAEHIKDLAASESVVVVGVFKDVESEEFKAFSSVANLFRSDYVFVHTTDSSLLPETGGPLAAPAVRLLKQFDEGFADIATFEVEALKAFVEQHAVPLVIEFSQDPKDRTHLTKVFESSKPKALLFYSYKADNAADFRAEYTAVAKANSDSIYFVIGEAAVNDHALKYFGLTAADTPAIIIHDPESDGKFVKKSIQPADIAPFVAKYKAGEAERVVKSEAIPADNSGPVKVLVANALDDMVFKSGKNVLIEFYAPWCGHCKKLEPIYKEVGEELASDPDVIVAKMDATANDVPQATFSVKGFPTIYLYTSEGKVVSYSGDRGKAGLVEFVKKNKTPVKGAPSTEEAAEEAELASKAEEGEAEAEKKDEL
ncbi:hypothetical protein CLOM_g14253 [Closterium sp. NIES-68]|nr:hypothetical protein CLOM_g14253 [Closterium sp. NIES-68]GJP77143.1 hypothetical protein CLOP_g7575 [Closterium sp. NIES-67]